MFIQAYDLSQLFIDGRHQGKGLGFLAVEEILKRMKADGRYQKVVLCYIEGNEAARHLYKKTGFVHTGSRDGNEIIMQKIL